MHLQYLIEKVPHSLSATSLSLSCGRSFDSTVVEVTFYGDYSLPLVAVSKSLAQELSLPFVLFSFLLI